MIAAINAGLSILAAIMKFLGIFSDHSEVIASARERVDELIKRMEKSKNMYMESKANRQRARDLAKQETPDQTEK